MIKEDLSNIKLLEVDGNDVKTFDFTNPQQNQNLEVSDDEKSEHSNENYESTENSPQG